MMHYKGILCQIIKQNKIKLLILLKMERGKVDGKKAKTKEDFVCKPNIPD